MDIKGKIEAVIYAAEEPVTVEQIAAALKDVTDWQPEAELPVGDQSQPLAPAAETASLEVAAEPADRNPAEPVEATAPQKKLRKADPLSPLKAEVRAVIEQLISEYDAPDSGMEIRAVAGGYRMATKPEHHDGVRRLAK